MQRGMNATNNPLTNLMIDLKVKNMTKDQIRQNYREGRYKGASEAHVKGYVGIFCG